jgi:hypothetical protein
MIMPTTMLINNPTISIPSLPLSSYEGFRFINWLVGWIKV